MSLGFSAILLNDPFLSPLIIFAAGLADFLDGLLARMLGVKSDLGAQLDSFADLVSFGIAPAYLYYHHVLNPEWISMCAVILIPVFSTVRLAVFNLDSSQKTIFKGLPTPANGLFFTFMVFSLSLHENFEISHIILLMLPLMFGLLMISTIPMLTIKGFKTKAKTERVLICIFILLAAILFILYQWMIIPFIILIYILFSGVYGMFFRAGKIKQA